MGKGNGIDWARALTQVLSSLLGKQKTVFQGYEDYNSTSDSKHFTTNWKVENFYLGLPLPQAKALFQEYENVWQAPISLAMHPVSEAKEGSQNILRIRIHLEIYFKNKNWKTPHLWWYFKILFKCYFEIEIRYSFLCRHQSFLHLVYQKWHSIESFQK